MEWHVAIWQCTLDMHMCSLWWGLAKRVLPFNYWWDTCQGWLCHVFFDNVVTLPCWFKSVDMLAWLDTPSPAWKMVLALYFTLLFLHLVNDAHACFNIGWLITDRVVNLFKVRRVASVSSEDRRTLCQKKKQRNDYSVRSGWISCHPFFLTI